jgi:hypothetical protein
VTGFAKRQAAFEEAKAARRQRLRDSEPGCTVACVCGLAPSRSHSPEPPPVPPPVLPQVVVAPLALLVLLALAVASRAVRAARAAPRALFGAVLAPLRLLGWRALVALRDDNAGCRGDDSNDLQVITTFFTRTGSF